eukprot:GSChrysophyteH2.ASY1.ANO1.693.1 assembled CDS
MSSNQTENQASAGNKKGATKKGANQAVPVFQKYNDKATQNWLDPSAKLKPSDLEKPSLNVSADDYPLIIEFCNLQDNSSQIHSTVEIDRPLFKPAPKVVIFEDYAPFATHEKKLFFRNNDSVARRIKLVQPESAFFEMSAPRLPSGEPLRNSAIAAGMEVYFVVIFKPQEVRDYSWDLVCCTEREKFIVPIRAIGMRPRVTFPDSVDFGFCPVKSAMRKVLLVQNIGAAAAVFTMRSLVREFSCPGEEMVVEPGASQMIELFLTPPTAEVIEGEYEIQFKKGPKCFITATGAGKNVNVSLSTPSVALDPSYISLTSQSIVKIRNNSEIPIDFKWKSFIGENDEDAERTRLMAEVNHDMGNEITRAEEASLVRKYRNLRRALEVDSMLFVDDIFDISPTEGQVWANSELEVTVSFIPDTAAQYSCFAYLDISGRENRLPLNMAGQGIGPHATLSFDVLDVGDVFINDEQKYKISIINKGDISAQWHFESSLTRFGSKFKFFPTEGQLAPGDSQDLEITFESDILGEFSENFRFALQGNEDMLVCQVKGHVVGPTFHFDCSNIDFGIVSYDYLHESKMRLVNSSKIAMVFNLHVPQDGTYLKKEFNVEPCEGTLLPGQHMDILLEFIPASVKVYDYSLVVDVYGVGDILLSVPISAECVVSPVVLKEREIDFGDCFIRYPYEKEITLSNSSNLVHTKFEVLPQQNYTKATATFEAEPAIAVIEPNDFMNVTVRLVCEKLGSFKIPILIQTSGSQEPPQQAVLLFNVVGPRIIVDQPEMRWGNVECLKDSTRTLRVTNDSSIMANMKLFLKQARSKFELAKRELTLEPFEYYDLDITANLDDSVVCKEEVHFIVEESDNVMVPLSAKGVGTTMHCGTDLSELDMGVQLTNTTFEKRIVLENKGRRPQFLKWYNKTNNEINAERADKVKNLGKDITSIPKNLQPREPWFTVALEEITLRPRTATTFVFKGRCNAPGLISETLVLESRVGKERVMKPIIECTVKSEVVNPLLEFSVNEMDFIYKWQRGIEPTIQQRELVLKNASAVPLSCLLKTEVPFNLSSFECILQPGESTDVVVDFDPLYKDNKQSHLIENNLSIQYRGHPQRDHVRLTGDIIFPNLEFETKNINFGCILNDTRKTIRFKVTNTSKVITRYDWCFLEEVHKRPAMGNRKAAKDDKHSPSSLVDILPINSVLQPGESEYVEFSFFGLPNSKINGQVLCNVEGGPEYKLNVHGEASQMAYALDSSFVDFGRVTYTENAQQEFVIKNTGKVPYEFNILPGTPAASELIDILPSSGRIAAGESLTVQLVVYPGMPAYLKEDLLIHIAHFDPVRLTCYCQGIYPIAVVSLPRYRRTGPYNETEGMEMPPAHGNTSTMPEFAMPLPPPQVELMEDSASVVSIASNKGPSQQALEVEMTRMTMCHLLEDKVIEVTEELAKTAAAPAVVEVEEEKPKRGAKGKPSATKVEISKHIDMTKIVAATHLCDFGNVIIGQSRKKAFKITNASLLGQLNWNFDTTKISSQGFMIEPFKAQKMIEGDSLDFVVKFTARSTAKLGKKHAVLPLECKGSPTINIVLSSCVCLPEVNLSSELVDMEQILVGQTKKMYIRLHNPTPVTANWALKRVPGKDEKMVTVTPSEGTLRSNKKCIVCVEFMPNIPVKIAQEFTLKVDNNKEKPKVLKVIGEGLGAVLKWDMPMMELGPIIPYTDGSEKVITLNNNSKFDVEIFSLDFDNTYKNEESTLSQLEIYDREGLYRCPIREVGATLPGEILENGAAPRDEGKHQDIIVFGPPLSGVTTVANQLGKKLSLNVGKFDALLNEVALTDGEIGSIARRSFKASGSLTAETIAKIVTFRLSWSDAGWGFVIDSLVSDFASTDAVLKGLEIALPKAIVANIERSKLAPKAKKAKKGAAATAAAELTAAAAAAANNTEIVYAVPLVIAKIQRIWSPESGLVDPKKLAEAEAAAAAEAEGAEEEKKEGEASEAAETTGDGDKVDAEGSSEEKTVEPEEPEEANSTPSLKLEKVVYYADYVETLLPLVSSSFQTFATPVDESPVEGGEEKAAEAAAVESGEKADDEAKAEVVDAVIDSGVFEIQVEAEDDEENVINNVLALLPQPKVAPEDLDKLPESTVQQLIRKPYPRSERRAVRCFEILRVDPVKEEDAAEDAAAEPAAENSEAEAAAAAAAAADSYRWVVPGNGQIQVKIRMRSKTEGKYDANLGFEVMGTSQTFNLHCSGFCEVPAINTDSRNVFMRRVKGIPPGAAPAARKFVINQGTYSFGPLLIYKQPSWKALQDNIKMTNTDTIRITNSGRFKASVDLGFENPPTEEKYNDLFQVEPKVLELEEGETKDIRIWSFPQEVGEFKNTLIAAVKDNAIPMLYPITCHGKLQKELEDKVAALKSAFTFDFDRLLVGKTDSKSFTVKNTSYLPVAWEIDLGSFKDSANVTISPDAGVIPVNGEAEVTVSFTSPEPIVLEGDFKLKFSDAENGLSTEDRVGVRDFKVLTEAYDIQSVALNAEGQEENGSAIDYGIVRVGDYASQIVKIGNKGKYQIGYKFVISKPALASLVTITDGEGVIDAGETQAQIKLTFCSKDAEMVLPDARFNRFRLQPSKGVTFGAVRFDAEAKTKRVELRNESKFDFTYVICPKSAEVDELDALDAPALDPLVVGAFKITPRIGRVSPGETVGIDMTFDPNGCDLARERLRVCISGVDPNDNAAQVLRNFEVTGESCFPAILNKDVDSIFEEQEVVENMAESIPGGGGKIEKLPVGKGVVERIRITNPTKIDVKVKFQVKNGAPASDEATTGAFTVQPELWEIPPHEHRVVSVYFNPTEIKSYRSVFEAEVDYEGSSSTAGPKASGCGKTLTFDLAGSGSMPCIAVAHPTERAADGSLALDFGKVHIDRKGRRRLTIRNDGVMPATCLFQVTGDSDFSFPFSNASLSIEPGDKKEMFVSFAPKKVGDEPSRSATIKVTVLNNQFDQYIFKMSGTTYACDATIDMGADDGTAEQVEVVDEDDTITMSELNISEGPASTSKTITVQSRSNYPIKFAIKAADDVPAVLSFSPSCGHLGPNGKRDVTVTFAPTDQIDDDEALWGKWDDALSDTRVATEEDLAIVKQAEEELRAYEENKAAQEALGKKGKPGGEQMLDITPAEPYFEVVPDSEEQTLDVKVNAVADVVKYSCQYEGENIPFKPTHLFQSTLHQFTFTNECNISLPISWTCEDIKHRTTTAPPSPIPCPFFIDPEECEVKPLETKTFTLKFQPLDADDFVYALKAEGEAEFEKGALRGPVRMVLRGTAKRPNEMGLLAPIEATDLRCVELESTGLRTRNTFRFHIINPTGDNYEFIWETCGDPSASWRCVQKAGMLFAGKRIEVVFEYLPEETGVAESFFKFRLPNANLEQMFLFSGNVVEPRVFFSTSRLDFHSVMLGGQGHLEQIYLENNEHLPFNFQFDKASLAQLDGANGPVLEISPKQGTVAPHGKVPISLLFKPQDEVIYNYNIICDVKRKPNKLSINVKGEGYAVHPVVQLELNEEQIRNNASDSRYQTLKPRPAVNYADFGSVKVLDTTSKKLTVTNNGKYNFDYLWDIENLGSMLALTGGRTGGTLHKGEEMSYEVTFAPQREATLDGSNMSFTVAGKYTYDIFARGIAQSPALRFAFTSHDFGPCFVTSPGGQTVVVETSLRLVNHDPTSNISVECNFQKTRALWVECPPTVLEPGSVLDVPIRFAPRDVKDYTFVIPFVINATSKANVTILGKGISARLEMVNASQRRTPFGIVNVGNEVRKTIPIVNRSKKALPVQIVEDMEFGSSSLEQKCITIFPRSEFVIAPRETVNLQVSFSPNRRISQFSEDIMVKYAGIMRKLVTLSGKGQGMEVSLDTDSLPFGNVVINSSQQKTLSLENSGDVAITFQWMENTFGRHFSISPLQGKVQPNSEMTFDVTFCPVNIDDDIRQDNIILQIPGISPLNLTCTGACIDQPGESTSTLQFNSIARKKEEKTIKFSNPSDKDWFLAPTLHGINWKVPNEVKVPAKGSTDCVVTYYPLTMCPEPATPPGDGEEDPAHKGKLFVALPDGTAQLYNLRGYAGPPACSGVVELETAAKSPCSTTVRLNNWLSETQKLKVTIDITEKPSPATFIVAANAVEVNPNGSKEFPIRFISYLEGTSKGTVTFTNPVTGEYAFYELVAKTTMPEVLEEIKIESFDMDCHSDDSWWSCDSDCIRVKELTPFSGNPEGSFEIEYRPLAPTAQPGEHLLSITCKSLGTYKYKLIVTATRPPLPQSLKFEVPLGSVQTEYFKFKSFNSAKVDYQCAIQNSDLFTVPKSQPVDPCAEWDGMDVRIPVAFEPMAIGNISDQLVITAPNGIEYLCDVHATCIPPQPQGPFNLVLGGGSVDIPFRNYFSQPQGWSFAVDSPHFKLASASAQVGAKASGNCQVSFSPEEGAAASGLTAKLFVTCTAKPEVAPFVFYLRGSSAGEGTAPPAGKKK